MLRADFDSVFSPDARRFVGGPYGLASTMNLLNVSQMLHLTGAYGSVAYVFESGAIGAGEVQKVFEENLKNPRQKEEMRLDSLAFADKRDVVQLTSPAAVRLLLCA